MRPSLGQGPYAGRGRGSSVDRRDTWGATIGLSDVIGQRVNGVRQLWLPQRCQIEDHQFVHLVVVVAAALEQHPTALRRPDESGRNAGM